MLVCVEYLGFYVEHFVFSFNLINIAKGTMFVTFFIICEWIFDLKSILVIHKLTLRFEKKESEKKEKERNKKMISSLMGLN